MSDKNKAGVKHDKGKLKPRLVMQDMALALQAVAAVATYGAHKYTEGGWLDVPDGRDRYTDALYRHLLANSTDSIHDHESGLLHLAHAAWNALAVLELELRSGADLTRPHGTAIDLRTGETKEGERHAVNNR